MEKFIAARDGIDLGMGFNTLTGEVRGLGAIGEASEAGAGGQKVVANARMIETETQMSESLNVSVEASGHYGLFSAEGRFGLSQETSYTAQSTYVIAKCLVENPFVSLTRAEVHAEAARRMRDSGPEAFKSGYGDAFVRGLRTGGELYVVFQMTSSSTTEQTHVAASLQAEVQGLLAGGSVKTSVETMSKAQEKNTSVVVTFYQRAGRDSSIAPITDPQEIAKRLKEFPTIARAAPAAYAAQIVDYGVLALPPFDEVAFRQRVDALEDYARLKMKFSNVRAEIETVRRNPNMFVQSYSDNDLAKASDLYVRAINRLNAHARDVSALRSPPDLFDPGAHDPALKELPLFVFKKLAPASDLVEVPRLVDLPVSEARRLLTDAGLVCRNNSTTVGDGSNAPVEVVMSQVPAAGTTVSKGAAVVVDYNRRASNRFTWLDMRRRHDLVMHRAIVGH